MFNYSYGKTVRHIDVITSDEYLPLHIKPMSRLYTMDCERWSELQFD